jgi:hypothetical protein
MIVEDVFRVVNEVQVLIINVMMQDDVDGTTETFCMEWTGKAKDIPMRIMKASVTSIRAFMDEDCCFTGEIELYCEE